ncbi:SRPBCC family protein [Krasilnikovia sp. MM14-A1259]|uniref:SRPBCC family protein n=1 Tax=Krasilnikovia sp. MM14-A1259 TaxID=3373539 RepID=UPI00380FEE7D
MSTVAVTRLVEAPVSEVWRVFTDLSRRAEWLSTVHRVEPLTRGDFGTGTAWREARTMADGTEITEEFRVRECAAPEQFVVESPGIGADYRMTYAFAPVESGRHSGGTMVAAVQDGTPTEPRGRLLALVFGGLAARTVEGALRQDLDDLAHAAAHSSTEAA